MKKPSIIIPSDEALAKRRTKSDALEERLFGAALRYSRTHSIFTLSLRSGVLVMFPAREIPEFAKATTAQLSKVRLSPVGDALEQRELDVDVSVPGLLREVFGFGEIQQRVAGRVRTPAKSAASRANGAKGGRPRKHIA